MNRQNIKIAYMKIIRKSTLFLFILFIFQNTNAQQLDSDRFIDISYANDLFTGTDEYFTQGIRIEVVVPIFRKTPINLISFLPKRNSESQYSIALQQDGFTPSSIRYDSILQGDRPYCASLFITNSQYSYYKNKKMFIHSQLAFGAIGPLALGYEEQTAIHKAIKDELPKGWKNQIQNDLIMNYTFEMQQNFFTKSWISVAYNTQARLGTMFTDVAIGLNAKFGLYNDNFKAQKSKLQIYGFGNTHMKAVAYNATLQGGMLNKSSDYTISQSNIKRLIPIAEIGVGAGYRKLNILFSHTNIGKEFTSGANHAWGKLSLMIGF